MTVCILVLDDDPLDRKLVRDILEFHGHRVIEAASKEQVAQSLGVEQPDLIVVDIQMSDGDGEALLRELRSIPALHSLPVVAVTARAMQGDRERLLATGFDGYLSKPINTRTFAGELTALLARR